MNMNTRQQTQENCG